MEGLERNGSKTPAKGKIAATKGTPIQRSNLKGPKPAPKNPAPKPTPSVVNAKDIAPVTDAKTREFTPTQMINIIKTVLKIKFGVVAKSAPDKVDILRFEINPDTYTEAVTNAKDTLSDLSARACEGYISNTTVVTPDIILDPNEKFAIFALTTDRMKKVFLSVFINGDSNLTVETLGEINHHPDLQAK